MTVKRKEKVKRFKPKRTLAMTRLGKNKSRMKRDDRYPRLIFRVGDELLSKIAREIDTSGMSTSQIAKKALSEYFERKKEVAN